MVELRLSEDAMGERLVGCEARLFEQGRIVCREREREREARRFFEIWEGGWRESALGSEKAAEY